MNIPVLVLSLLLGILLPWGHAYTFLIRYLVMGMLFFAFLEMEVTRKTVRWSHLWILLANISLAVLSFWLLRPLNLTLALTAFAVAIMPTAAAAPAITGYLHGRVDYVTFSTFFTTVVMASLLPLGLPILLAGSQVISIEEVLLPVLSLMLIPLGLAAGVRVASTRLRHGLLRGKPLSAWMFMGNIYLASSKASHFVRTEMAGNYQDLLWIGLIAGVLCLIQFELGKWLGGPRYRLEGGMGLGRKNTMFSVWLALTFLHPLAALGPMCYIVWQNTYNSIQLWQQKQQAPSPHASTTHQDQSP